jgi:putative hydrolase of the HAD superfamily
VIFDIYGTLLVSAAGDIAAKAGDGSAPEAAPLRGTGLDALAGEYGCTGELLRDFFHRAVLRIHRDLRSGTTYPEVRTEEIWADFLRQQWAPPPGGPGTPPGVPEEGPGAGMPTDGNAAAEELALRYELTVNPVYPMPGAEETLGILRRRGIRLGLISNAQFFTPLLFEAFFGAPPELLGFDPELLIYSYKLGEAKPSPALFAPAVRRLESLGQKTEQVLYVGNDMLNDMYAASEAGFRTGLFAGDRRSLRLREGDPRVRGLRPDRVIRALGDMPGMIAGSGLPGGIVLF